MAGSTTKTSVKKTTQAEAAPAVETAATDNSAVLAKELASAQAEISALKGQVSALSPTPEPEPEPLTLEERVANCEHALDGVLAALKDCFSPRGMPSKLLSRLNDRGL